MPEKYQWFRYNTFLYGKFSTEMQMYFYVFLEVFWWVLFMCCFLNIKISNIAYLIWFLCLLSLFCKIYLYYFQKTFFKRKKKHIKYGFMRTLFFYFISEGFFFSEFLLNDWYSRLIWSTNVFDDDHLWSMFNPPNYHITPTIVAMLEQMPNGK